MDIFSTNVLAKVVERLHTPSSFLLDTFFPNVQTSDKEEIFFDVTDSKPRISPFVSPLLPGKVVDSGGYQTKSFKPAYVKDKRRLMQTFRINALPVRLSAALCRHPGAMNALWPQL